MELGLPYLFPVITKHLASGSQSAGREERWERVLIAAAKQCKRDTLLTIAPPMAFADFLVLTADFPLRVMAHTDESLPSLKTQLRQHTLDQPILAIVGPEGGFAEDEITQARAHGVQLFSLGRYTLRAETAALAIIANLNFHFA